MELGEGALDALEHSLILQGPGSSQGGGSRPSPPGQRLRQGVIEAAKAGGLQLVLYATEEG